MLRKVDVETKGEQRRMSCETSEVPSEDDETDIRRMIRRSNVSTTFRRLAD